MPRCTKIVATLGPATDDLKMMTAILQAGVDVARINFSHGKAEEHHERIARFRQAAESIGKIVAVLADLPGPKLRTVIDAPRHLAPDSVFAFSLGSAPAQEGDIVITEPEVLADVQPGQRILLDDGRLQAEAVESQGGRLLARVRVGGTLGQNKGINLPDTPLSIAAVTDRDRKAIEVAAACKVDWLALSFVRGPEAATELREIARAAGYTGPILAKIERPEAVRRAAVIIQAFDGIMVARGDLGVEIPLERVPIAQKQLIAEARLAGKPVITATDMLDSMRSNPRPTRAEASDVANAIFDGTDAVMLSGETAIGQYPVEAVAAMARIVQETEGHLAGLARDEPTPRLLNLVRDPDEAFAVAVCTLAREYNAAAIITPTLSGRSARLIARHRPWARIVGPSPDRGVCQQMVLSWGVTPVQMSTLPPGGDRMAGAVRDAFQAGAVSVGERVVVLAGHPIDNGPAFPTARVVRVGEHGESLEPR